MILPAYLSLLFKLSADGIKARENSSCVVLCGSAPQTSTIVLLAAPLLRSYLITAISCVLLSSFIEVRRFDRSSVGEYQAHTIGHKCLCEKKN